MTEKKHINLASLSEADEKLLLLLFEQHNETVGRQVFG